MGLSYNKHPPYGLEDIKHPGLADGTISLFGAGILWVISMLLELNDSVRLLTPVVDHHSGVIHDRYLGCGQEYPRYWRSCW
jgi:hypothetical protein